eukprot:339600_1
MAASNLDSGLLLTFEQSTIYGSDVQTLNNGKWLNDTMIGFAYDIFAHKVYANAPNNSLLFVHPTTVNVIRFENDIEDLIPLIQDSGIPNYDYVFLPINNSRSMFSVGGSHWALLIYQRHNNTFYYLDSAGSYNLAYATKMANKLYPFINDTKQNKKQDESEEKQTQNIDYVKVVDNFIKLKVPQQENGYDCGMYVIEFTRFVAQFYLTLQQDKQNKDKQALCVSNAPFFNTDTKFDSDYMIRKRKDWRKVVNDMSKQQHTTDTTF